MKRVVNIIKDARACNLSRTHAHTSTHARTLKHTRAHAHTHTHTRTHARARAHTHTHTNAHTHTHTHKEPLRVIFDYFRLFWVISGFSSTHLMKRKCLRLRSNMTDFKIILTISKCQHRNTNTHVLEPFYIPRKPNMRT